MGHRASPREDDPDERRAYRYPLPRGRATPTCCSTRCSLQTRRADAPSGAARSGSRCSPRAASSARPASRSPASASRWRAPTCPPAPGSATTSSTRTTRRRLLDRGRQGGPAGRLRAGRSTPTARSRGPAAPRPLDIERPAAQNQRQPLLRRAAGRRTALTEVRGQVCARLDARQRRRTRASTWPPIPTRRRGRRGASPPAQKTVRIDRGRGAFVRSALGRDDQHLDVRHRPARPVAYALVGGETLTKLGYDGHRRAVHPGRVAGAVRGGGVAVDERALCPPAVPDAQSQDEDAPSEEPSASESASASAAPNPAGCRSCQ